jgi:hypothetical protein
LLFSLVRIISGLSLIIDSFWILNLKIKLTIMKKILLVLCSIVAAGTFSFLEAQTQEEMKKMMDYATPSDMHKEMAKWDGEWTGRHTNVDGPGCSCSNHASDLRKQNGNGRPLPGIENNGQLYGHAL